MSLLVLFVVLPWQETSGSEVWQQLAKVVFLRSATYKTELLNGTIVEHNKGVKVKEFTFEAARSAENEMVVSTRILPNGREELRATLLRPDSSYLVFKDRDARSATVSTHSKSLQYNPHLLHEELGFDRKELHANLFEDYFFREYVDPVIRKTAGYYLVDFQRNSNDCFDGTIYFDESVKIHFRDESIHFVLANNGRLKQWSYPLRFDGDPKTYRSVIDLDRTSNGILRSIEQKYFDGETIGYKKVYSIKKHEVDVPLPSDQFSLSRFGLQESRTAFPLIWLLFVLVTVGCLTSIAVFRRFWSKLQLQ